MRTSLIEPLKKPVVVLKPEFPKDKLESFALTLPLAFKNVLPSNAPFL